MEDKDFESKISVRFEKKIMIGEVFDAVSASL
jgi:hypothetical protein